MTTPLVALQRPKDISLDEIEAELSKIWHSQNDSQGDSSPKAAIRATTFSMVIYEPEEFQQLLGALGFYSGPIDGIHGPQTKAAIIEAQQTYGLRMTGRVDPQTRDRLRSEFALQPADRTKTVANPNVRGYTVSDAIAVQNPCRIITICPVLGADEGVTAQVSAYCPIQKNTSSLICCEYITLRGTKAALERVSGTVASLMVHDLPKFVWWKATPNPEQELFHKLSEVCNCMILDSCYFSEPQAEFQKMQDLIEAGTYIADLNWHRLEPWQELTAAVFDPPERRAALREVDRVTIDYEKGNAAQALMYLGWMASRLDWEPVSITRTGGDYELTHIQFTAPDQRSIEAELAAIPMADWGEIPGDLVGLRLTSTNPDADCCTILCSETSGCMRMEAGGSAQSCRTEQVSALSDQKAEFLLGQQLQRWGQDVLYEESLTVVAKILRSAQG